MRQGPHEVTLDVGAGSGFGLSPGWGGAAVSDSAVGSEMEGLCEWDTLKAVYGETQGERYIRAQTVTSTLRNSVTLGAGCTFLGTGLLQNHLLSHSHGYGGKNHLDHSHPLLWPQMLCHDAGQSTHSNLKTRERQAF